MRKIISLFQRNYDGDYLVRDEVVPGAEWVLAGEGIATRKWDGICCMVRDGKLYRRYDRRVGKATKKKMAKDPSFVPLEADFKFPPEGWEPAEMKPSLHTGHWPGWLPVLPGDPEKHFLESEIPERDGTYELCGPKVNRNSEGLRTHVFIRHGEHGLPSSMPRTFEGIRDYLEQVDIEGIVWHHSDGRMVKIKKKDFGLSRSNPKKED